MIADITTPLTFCRNCHFRKTVRTGSLKGMDLCRHYLCRASPRPQEPPDLVGDGAAAYWVDEITGELARYELCETINHGSCIKYVPKFKLMRFLRNNFAFLRNKEEA
jgi:hypothetical protein